MAATGVGAGDLATGAITGSKLGVVVLWAVVVGAILKFVLTEGLTRWQLATDQTLLEGCVTHFGGIFQLLFLAYLLLWSFFVGSALMSACGVAAHAILPLFDGRTDKIIYGLIHSAVAVLLVKRGGYRLFEKVMSCCIAVMFVTVIVTAVLSQPSWTDIGRGLIRPTIPDIHGSGLEWTIALIGGVGGTLTILCYGYWIREDGRQGPDDLQLCRIDLAIAYAMTALFGIGMVILGSTIEIDEKHKAEELIVLLANQLEGSLGPLGTFGRWLFLIGAWGAVASSLLGVWQCVPHLFADFYRLVRRRRDNGHTAENQDASESVETSSLAYRGYLYALATIPALGLTVDFQRIQKFYAIVGAAFIPMLALALLILNGRTKWVGDRCRNSQLTTFLLVATLLFFLIAGWFKFFV